MTAQRRVRRCLAAIGIGITVGLCVALAVPAHAAPKPPAATSPSAASSARSVTAPGQTAKEASKAPKDTPSIDQKGKPESKPGKGPAERLPYVGDAPNSRYIQTFLLSVTNFTPFTMTAADQWAWCDANQGDRTWNWSTPPTPGKVASFGQFWWWLAVNTNADAPACGENGWPYYGIQYGFTDHTDTQWFATVILPASGGDPNQPYGQCSVVDSNGHPSSTWVCLPTEYDPNSGAPLKWFVGASPGSTTSFSASQKQAMAEALSALCQESSHGNANHAASCSFTPDDNKPPTSTKSATWSTGQGNSIAGCLPDNPDGSIPVSNTATYSFSDTKSVTSSVSDTLEESVELDLAYLVLKSSASETWSKQYDTSVEFTQMVSPQASWGNRAIMLFYPYLATKVGTFTATVNLPGNAGSTTYLLKDVDITISYPGADSPTSEANPAPSAVAEQKEVPMSKDEFAAFCPGMTAPSGLPDVSDTSLTPTLTSQPPAPSAYLPDPPPGQTRRNPGPSTHKYESGGHAGVDTGMGLLNATPFELTLAPGGTWQGHEHQQDWAQGEYPHPTKVTGGESGYWASQNFASGLNNYSVEYWFRDHTDTEWAVVMARYGPEDGDGQCTVFSPPDPKRPSDIWKCMVGADDTHWVLLAEPGAPITIGPDNSKAYPLAVSALCGGTGNPLSCAFQADGGQVAYTVNQAGESIGDALEWCTGSAPGASTVTRKFSTALSTSFSASVSATVGANIEGIVKADIKNSTTWGDTFTEVKSYSNADMYVPTLVGYQSAPYFYPVTASVTGAFHVRMGYRTFVSEYIMSDVTISNALAPGTLMGRGVVGIQQSPADCS